MGQVIYSLDQIAAFLGEVIRAGASFNSVHMKEFLVGELATLDLIEGNKAKMTFRFLGLIVTSGLPNYLHTS